MTKKLECRSFFCNHCKDIFYGNQDIHVRNRHPTKPIIEDETNYQCSCGLCFFAREVELIQEHHRLTNHSQGKFRTPKAIMNDCLRTIRGERQ